ncbi:MAG: hypothetical protein R3297_11665, partial [Desulfobulbales bacterium]|nr:hypothetical protein [Desulfobulbales bacterium]
MTNRTKPVQPQNLLQPLLVLCLLLVITLALYWQAREFPFFYLDDDAYIIKNTNIQNGLTLESLRRAFLKPYAGFWIPLTWLSYMVDFELSGLDPSGFHLTNILLHGAKIILLVTLLYKMTGYGWRSLLVAALFALHPL